MNELKLKDDRKATPPRSPLSPRIRFKVLQRDGFTCQYCGRTASERELEIDHIVPISKGGTHYIENLQTSCKECNRGKTDIAILDIPNEKTCNLPRIIISSIPLETIEDYFKAIHETLDYRTIDVSGYKSGYEQELAMNIQLKDRLKKSKILRDQMIKKFVPLDIQKEFIKNGEKLWA